MPLLKECEKRDSRRDESAQRDGLARDRVRKPLLQQVKLAAKILLRNDLRHEGVVRDLGESFGLLLRHAGLLKPVRDAKGV
jgi:hypothetical protein